MKIGLFGGTFDPIHRAHVTLADSAVKELGLDELYFIPAFVSPFKLGVETEEGIDRYKMIEQILHYNTAFKVSDYELSKEDTSYTFNTLEHFAKSLDGDIYFLLGYDSLVQLDTWYRGKEILAGYDLITARRPGTRDEEAERKIEEYIKLYDARIHILDMPAMDVSATEIRERIAKGEDIKELVLPEVEEYIIEHNLYR